MIPASLRGALLAPLTLTLSLSLSACFDFNSLPPEPDASVDGGADAAHPLADAGPCGSPCTPQVIAGGLHLPLALAVNATHAYWTELGDLQQIIGTLNRIAKGGCPQPGGDCREVLADMRADPSWLALAPTAACWTETFNIDDESQVLCFDIATAGLRVVATGQYSSVSLIVDGDNLLWANDVVQGQMMTLPIAAVQGQMPQALLTGLPSPSSVAVAGEMLFWTQGNAVMSAARDGTGAHLIDQEKGPFAMVAWDEYVYWTNSVGELRRVRGDGNGSATTIGMASNTPAALAVDDSGIYWIEGGLPPDYLDQRLMRAGLDGAAPHAVAHGIPAGQAIALDGQSVYWIEQGTSAADYADGALKRLPEGL